jgi:uncharacterized protein YqkB
MIKAINLDGYGNLKYSLKYNYNTEYSCEESGCDSEGICRCGTITDASVSDVDISSLVNEIYSKYFDDSKSTKRNSKINSVLFGSGSDIDKYCIDRILRINKVWEDDRWDIDISGGYYGDELNDITMSSTTFNSVSKSIEEILEMETIGDKIKYILKLEYGYLLPGLDDNKYEYDVIDTDDIVFGSDGQYKKVSRECLDHYSGYDHIKAIVKRDGDKYKIIDGYHRMYVSVTNKIKKSKVIIVG